MLLYATFSKIDSYYSYLSEFCCFSVYNQLSLYNYSINMCSFYAPMFHSKLIKSIRSLSPESYASHQQDWALTQWDSCGFQ